MRNATPVLRLTAAVTLAVVFGSVAPAQTPDAFRITGGRNRVPIQTPATPGIERQLQESFMSERAYTDLMLTAEVTFKSLNRAEYAVPISVRIAPGNELTIGRGERSRFDFIAAVTDSSGVTHANMRDAAELTLNAESIPALAKTPIVYTSDTFTLLPGRYTLKVLARDQTTGRIGSTNLPFTIPINREQPAK